MPVGEYMGFANPAATSGLSEIRTGPVTVATPAWEYIFKSGASSLRPTRYPVIRHTYYSSKVVALRRKPARKVNTNYAGSQKGHTP